MMYRVLVIAAFVSYVVWLSRAFAIHIRCSGFVDGLRLAFMQAQIHEAISDDVESLYQR